MSSRVLCCTGSLDGGGSERQLWQLATRIDPALFESHIYLLARRGPYLQRLPTNLLVHAFDDPAMPKLQSNWLAGHLPGQIHRQQVAHLVSILRRERIDVVYDRTFHMSLVTAAACRQTGIPRVSVIVSPPSRDFENAKERFKWLKRHLLARAYSDPQAITVAVSADVADDAAQFYGLRRESLRVIENPIDVFAVQQQAGMELPTSLPDPQEPGALTDVREQADGRIVVVGRLSREKGHQTVLSALAELRQQHAALNIHLDLLGDGPDLARLQAVARDLALDQQVRFVGYQTNPYPWIKRANLVCIASVYEGLPNVALEAMAIGTPLLATACSPALVALVGAEHVRGGLVPVGDVRQMAEKIYDSLAHADVWMERAERAQVWVAEHHGLDKNLRAVEEILQSSLALCPQRGTRT